MNKKQWTADNYLAHSGVKLMKWGVRRWQDYDGHLTPAGREHYGVGPPRGSQSKDEGKEKKPSLAESYLAKAKHPSLGGFAAYAISSKFKKGKEERKRQAEQERQGAANQKKLTNDLAKKIRAGEFNLNGLPKNKEYEEFESALKEYKEATKIEDDYWRNDSERRKYAAQLAEQKWPEIKKLGGYDDSQKDFYIWSYTDGDYDQGDSFELYARDKGIDLDAYATKTHKAWAKANEASNAYVDSIFGQYGKEKTVRDSENGRFKNGKFVPDEISVREYVRRRIATSW